MDDNKAKSGENQSPTATNPEKLPPLKPTVSERPSPIFEMVPADAEPVPPQSPPDEPIEAEEVSADVATPEQALQSAPPPKPPAPPTPPSSSHMMKFAIMGGGIVFFLLIFFGLLRFIFSSGTSAPKQVTLTYWGLWEEKEIMTPLIEQYQAKNPHVKIDYQKMVPQDYREKLLARSEKNQGPDIFRFHNTWVPELLLKDGNLLAPLPSSIMNGGEFEKTFYPIHAKDLKIGDYYYGIPLHIDGLVLVYNNGLFKKAGIAKAPASWEEMIEAVPKLSVKTKEGTIVTSGLAIGTASNVAHFSELFGLMLFQNGGDLRKLDQTEGAGTLEAYRHLAEPPTDFWDDTMPNSIAAFVQEKVAMIVVPTWEILTIKAQNPDIELKVAPVPVLPGTKPVSIATYWVEGVSVKSKNQIEAWKFLKYLSEKETMTKHYELQSKSRFFGEPYSRVDLASSLSQNEFAGVIIQQANNLITLPLVSRTYDNGLNDQILQNIENAINAAINGSSYSQALVGPTKDIERVFTQFKIE